MESLATGDGAEVVTGAVESSEDSISFNNYLYQQTRENATVGDSRSCWEQIRVDSVIPVVACRMRLVHAFGGLLKGRSSGEQISGGYRRGGEGEGRGKEDTRTPPLCEDVAVALKRPSLRLITWFG